MHTPVFVNRILNLKKIKYIGLDLDHTLVRYNSQAFEGLVYDLLLDRLIRLKGYPEKIRDLDFNYDWAIRGLVVDKKNGNILKLSRYGAIRNSFHGTKPIDFSEQKELYRSIYIDLSHPNYVPIDTSFSISYCVLYAQMVDLKDQDPHAFPSYEEIAQDVGNCLDSMHKDGSLKAIVTRDLDKYIIKDPVVVEGLLRYKKHGKKIFVVTNSEFYYAKTLLDAAINPFLGGGDWTDLFETVITDAQKPRFFWDDLKFLRINTENGTMTNLTGPIGAGVYQGGCANKFTRDLKINGDEILYIGDHIYGDILRLKKDCNWRTALVVEELEQEIEGYKKAAPITAKIEELMELKTPMEEESVELLSKKIEEDSEAYNDALSKLQKQITKIDQEISKLIVEQQDCFNPLWGRVFRSGAEESLFANQVDRFACIYMGKLSDLLHYSPRTYFRAVQRPLPHEMDFI